MMEELQNKSMVDMVYTRVKPRVVRLLNGKTITIKAKTPFTVSKNDAQSLKHQLGFTECKKIDKKGEKLDGNG